MPAATPSLQQEALDGVRKNFARYIPFVHRLPDGGMAVPASHHLVWASVLMDDSLGNTLIVAPPAHAKTNVVGVYYPDWYIGNNPNAHILYVGNTQPAAVRQSLAIRDTITDNARYQLLFPDVRPSKKNWGAERWTVSSPRSTSDDKDSTFKAAGVGGDVLGSRADRLLLDDIMDEENSATAHQREKLVNWVATTAMSRLTPQGRCITVMTRWHQEDIADWCRSVGFTVVHMPALSDGPNVYATITRYNEETNKDDLLSKILVHQNGPALWPEFYTEEMLKRQRTVLGPGNFAKMFQGLPVPAGGAIFQEKWWKYYTALPPMSVKIQTWDTAFQTKTTSDYSVCQTWGLGTNGRFYLLDMFRDRIEFPALKDKARVLYNKWRPSRVIIEERASGQSLIQELRREVSGKEGIPVIPFRDNNRDKVARANAVTGYFESGLVMIPRDDKASWVDAFRSEMQFFPAGAHDDMVDAAVMAVSTLAHYISPSLGDAGAEGSSTIVGNVFDRAF